MTTDEVAAAFPFLDSKWRDDIYVDPSGKKHLRDLAAYSSNYDNLKKDKIEGIHISFCGSIVTRFFIEFESDVDDPVIWSSSISNSLGIPNNWGIDDEDSKECCRTMKCNGFYITTTVTPVSEQRIGAPTVIVSSNNWSTSNNCGGSE
jgi:hypothetical protein